MESLLSSAVLPFDQGLKVILLENPKGWSLEEPPKHLNKYFSNMKGDEVTHQLGQRKQVNAKVEETGKKRHGIRRASSYTQPAGLTATLRFLFPLHICCKVAKFTNAHNPTVRRQGATFFPTTNMLCFHNCQSFRCPKTLEGDSL